MKTRVIVISAGDQSRWKNFRDTTRHLVSVEGESLLQRTCKQFLKYTDDVCVIGLDERYKVDNTSLYIIKTQNTHWRDAAKFLSSKNLWLADGRTVLVFGDTYFTPEAVKLIMTDKSSFKWFLRKGPSTVTGAGAKEIFALSFDSSVLNTLAQKLLYFVSYNIQENATWAWYKASVGTVVADLFNNQHFTVIDDWTQDFDTPEDLLAWEDARKKAKDEMKAARKKQKIS